MDMQLASSQPIAVVGASSNPEKYGYRIVRDLLQAGFPVYPINPKGGELLGQPVIPSLTELSATLSDEVRQELLVMTVVPPNVTVQIINECAVLGLQRVWMQPGSSSAFVEQEARKLGLAVTTDACFMVKHGIWKQGESA